MKENLKALDKKFGQIIHFNWKGADPVKQPWIRVESG